MTREDIVATAMRLIDERGADAFSVRRLAGELGVYPSAISWHVGDRSKLMGLISEAWMRGVIPSPVGVGWVEWLRAMGHAYRAAAHRHPNIARLIASELVNDVSAFGLAEVIVSKLAESNLPDDELVHAYNVVVGATVGFVDLEFARDPARSSEERQRIEGEIRRLDPEQYPALCGHLDLFADRAFSLRWTPADDNPMDDSFEYLVDIITAGLAWRARARRSPAQ